jgi:EAL domain-containing protein (putative c-di-GMP-specific phosphodiesterase class I)
VSEQPAAQEHLASAGSMHVRVIGPGLVAAQAAALRELDCGYAQGFLFARPMPADALRALLSTQLSAVAS